MSEITSVQRWYFATVGLLALWVGAWGTFAPTHVDRALPWLVPPLHARFLGAVYLSAGVMLANAVLARRQSDVRAMVVVVTLWTGALLVLSLFHLDQFDWSHEPVWFWFGAYVVYPLAGVWSLCAHRSSRMNAPGRRMRSWARQALFAQGLLTGGLALVLLCAPGPMVATWPWKITPLLAQVYSAPFLAYGVGCLFLSRDGAWTEARIVVRGTLVLCVFALIASLLHRGLFDAGRPATWVWFGAFGITAATSVAMHAVHPRKHVSS